MDYLAVFDPIRDILQSIQPFSNSSAQMNFRRFLDEDRFENYFDLFDFIKSSFLVFCLDRMDH